MRVLMIEDDAMIARGLQTGLQQQGFTVDWVADGTAAASALTNPTFDLILLDLGLPHRTGIELLRTFRANGHQTPAIILTARDELANRIAGLDAGADDYIVKPFDFDELLARMRSVLRRAAGRADPLLRQGNLTLNPASREVTLAGSVVNLSSHEYSVLEALLQRPGAVLSRTQLEDRLYGWAEGVASNAVEVYVHGLRRKLGSATIRTLRGVGYFVPKV